MRQTINFLCEIITDLDVCLDLQPKLLQVLDNRTVNRSTQVGMVVRHNTGLIADAVVYILHAALTEELVTSTEWDLDDRAQLRKFLGSVVLDICDPL